MKQWLLVFSLLAVPSAGCVSYNPHGHGGHFVAEHCPGGDPATESAPYQATYVLYQWRERPADPPPKTWVPEHEVCELYVRGLSKWDKIGFERDGDKNLYAVAGDEKILLEEGRYCWHVSPGERFPLARWMVAEFNSTVLTIVGLPFGIVGLAILSPFFLLFGIFFLPLALAPLFALPWAIFAG